MRVGVKNNEQLTNEIKILRDRYEALVAKVSKLQSDIDSKPKLSDLKTISDNLTRLIQVNSQDIANINVKLAKITLPDEPRYYLTQNEISSFQSNLAKLLAMMTSFEQLYKNLVAYSSNLSSH